MIRKSKYLLRLFMFCTLLSITPIIITGVVSYYIASNDSEQKMKESNQQILLQVQLRVEEVLKNLEISALQLVNSPLLLSTINEEVSSVQFQKIKEVWNAMSNLHMFFGVTDVYLASIEHDWLIRSRGFSDFQTSEQYEHFIEYFRKPVKHLWISDNLPSLERKLVDERTAYATRLVLKVPYISPPDSKRAMLVIEIDNGALLQLVTRDLPHNTSIHVLNENKIPIKADSEWHKSEQWFEATHENIADIDPQLESGYFETMVGGEKYINTFQTSSYTNWQYFLVNSAKDATKETRKIAILTLIITAVVSSIVFVLAFIGSRSLYSPIRKLFGMIQDNEEPVHLNRNKDEFQFIEERFHQLFSQSHEQHQQLQDQYKHVSELSIQKLLTGYMSGNEFLEKYEQYGLPSIQGKCAVLTIQIDTLYNTQYQEEDRELLMYAINNIIGELIPETERFDPVIINQYVALLMSSQEEDMDNAKKFFYYSAEKIQSAINSFLKLKVSIGISLPYDDIGKSKIAFREGRQVLDFREAFDHNHIFQYEENKEPASADGQFDPYIKVLKKRVVESVKACDIEQAEHVLREIVAESGNKKTGYYDHQIILMQLISEIFVLVQEHGVSVQKVLGERGHLSMYNHIMRLHSADEICIWFKESLFEPVISFLNEVSEEGNLNLANQLIKLIHSRYDQDISLESCSNILNYHPVYVSRVLKQATGKNFSEYLAEYRVSIAKDWLENTDLKVSEISERLTYVNPTGFIRAFRKVMGMTPGEYRKKYGKYK